MPMIKEEFLQKIFDTFLRYVIIKIMNKSVEKIMNKKRKKYTRESIVVTIVALCIVLFTEYKENIFENEILVSNIIQSSFNLEEIPEFSEEPYVVLNNNIPNFEESDKILEPFEQYSELDELGRCGMAFANICKELMPNEPRGEIGSVKPSGWHTVRYDDLVEGKYLYNRCHLIGYQLAGENANEENLITGTRYLNVKGMLPFENEVAEYVDRTNHHVLYRVTPIFKGDNLVASGVEMEAYSVEDEGEGICFHVYVYNNQPGVVIDYATGDSKMIDSKSYM